MTNEQKQLEIFRSGKVSAAVFKNAIPAMAAMLMALIYNLADTFFIGQTHDDLQVAAVTMCMHVFLIFMTVGTVFGIGGTSVISRALGEERFDYARRVSSFCVWTCIVAGVILACLFWIFMDQILRIMGVSADVWKHAKTYMMIVTISGPFVVVSNCFSGILRAEGQAKTSMMGMVLGNITNIILDPVMILVFGWEIAGAAVATVIGHTLGAIYYLRFYLRGSSLLSISPKDYSVKGNIWQNVLAIGVPASLGSLLMSVSQILLNNRMIQYGDMAVAGLGVASKVTMMTGMICIGLGQGVQPLLGYCVGARNWDRFKKALVFSMCFAFIISAVMTGVCFLFVEPIVSTVLTNPSAFDYGCQFARIMLTTGFLFGIYYVLVNTIQAMGAALPGLILNLSRQGILFIPLLLILESFLQINGLIWTQPVVDVLSLLLAIVMFIPIYRKMVKS